MILITNSAEKELLHLLSREDKATYVRIKVIGGGCSGLNYKLEFDKESTSDSDKTLSIGDRFVAIDARSALFLGGTELDYSGGLDGKGFTFSNPNAKRTCGCGSSFSV